MKMHQRKHYAEIKFKICGVTLGNHVYDSRKRETHDNVIGWNNNIHFKDL